MSYATHAATGEDVARDVYLALREYGDVETDLNEIRILAQYQES